MPRFDVYTNATVKQGLRYRVTASTPEEAARLVLEQGDVDPCHIKVMGEDCVSETLDWVWDEEGNQVTPAVIMESDYRE